jgi:hypothetical protein
LSIPIPNGIPDSGFLCDRLRDVAEREIHSEFDRVDGVIIAAMQAHIFCGLLNEGGALLDWQIAGNPLQDGKLFISEANHFWSFLVARSL